MRRSCLPPSLSLILLALPFATGCPFDPDDTPIDSDTSE